MDGHLKGGDFLAIFIIVAAITIAVSWWFKKKCGCSSAAPRFAPSAPSSSGPAKRPGVLSCA